MLSAIFSSLGGQIIDAFFGKALAAFEMYNKKQISIEELRVKLGEALLEAFKAVEVAHADTLAKTFDSFMKAVVQSRLMQITWAFVTISQALVLLWHQVGIPGLCYFVGEKACYPSSGSTVEWAYLLVGACLGMGPIVLRSGPGAGTITERMRDLIKK